MSPTHLLGDDRGDVVKIEMTGLVGHLGMKHDLQQEITELVPEIPHVAARDRIGDFVGLLDRVRRYRREGLLDIPGTAAFRVAEALA